MDSCIRIFEANYKPSQIDDKEKHFGQQIKKVNFEIEQFFKNY